MNKGNSLRNCAYKIADTLLYSGMFISMYNALQHPMENPTPRELLSAMIPSGIGLLVYTYGEISYFLRLAMSSKLSNLERLAPN